MRGSHLRNTVVHQLLWLLLCSGCSSPQPNGRLGAAVLLYIRNSHAYSKSERGSRASVVSTDGHWAFPWFTPSTYVEDDVTWSTLGCRSSGRTEAELARIGPASHDAAIDLLAFVEDAGLARTVVPELLSLLRDPRLGRGAKLQLIHMLGRLDDLRVLDTFATLIGSSELCKHVVEALMLDSAQSISRMGQRWGELPDNAKRLTLWMIGQNEAAIAKHLGIVLDAVGTYLSKQAVWVLCRSNSEIDGLLMQQREVASGAKRKALTAALALRASRSHEVVQMMRRLLSGDDMYDRHMAIYYAGKVYDRDMDNWVQRMVATDQGLDKCAALVALGCRPSHDERLLGFVAEALRQDATDDSVMAALFVIMHLSEPLPSHVRDRLMQLELRKDGQIGAMASHALVGKRSP